MAGAESSIVVNTSPETLFNVITDYEKYPEFLSDVESVRILEGKGNGCVVEQTINLMKRVTYSIRMSESAPNSILWSLVKSKYMKTNNGRWTLEDLGNGSTKATYSLEVGVGMFVPGRMIDKLTKGTLPATLQAFKQRAESR